MIRTMIGWADEGKPEPEPKHGERIEHAVYSWDKRPYWASIEYEGAVLATWEENHYDDSDFYAAVWDEGAQRVTSVCYASTRGWTYCNSANVDATDEVKAKADAWLVKWGESMLWDKAADDAVRPVLGQRVRIEKGQKHKGVEGVIAWRGEDPYRSSRYGTYKAYRIGVRSDDGEMHFVPEEYAVVLEPEDNMPAPEEIAEKAARWVRSQYRLPFTAAVYQAMF